MAEEGGGGGESILEREGEIARETEREKKREIERQGLQREREREKERERERGSRLQTAQMEALKALETQLENKTADIESLTLSLSAQVFFFVWEPVLNQFFGCYMSVLRCCIALLLEAQLEKKTANIESLTLSLSAQVFFLNLL